MGNLALHAGDICTGTFWGGGALTPQDVLPSQHTCTGPDTSAFATVQWQKAAQLQSQPQAANRPVIIPGPQGDCHVSKPSVRQRERKQTTAKPGAALHSLLQQQEAGAALQASTQGSMTQPEPPRQALVVTKPSIPSIRRPASFLKAAAAHEPRQKQADTPSAARGVHEGAGDGHIPAARQPAALMKSHVGKPTTHRIAAAPAHTIRAMPGSKAAASSCIAPPCHAAPATAAPQRQLNATAPDDAPSDPTAKPTATQSKQAAEPKQTCRKRIRPDDLDASVVESKVQQKLAAGALHELNMNEMKVALKARKLAVGGKKGDLVARLQESLQKA